MQQSKKRQAERERTQAEDELERQNLWILCLECGKPCHLDVWYTLGATGNKIKHERWNCEDERHN